MSAEAISGYDARETGIQLRLADRAYQDQVLGIANETAEGLIAEGGITRDLGRFTVAMFGSQNAFGSDRVQLVRSYLKGLHDQFSDIYALPVATNHKGYSIGHTPMPELLGGVPCPLVYSLQQSAKYFEEYVGTVSVELTDVHTLDLKKQVTRQADETFELAKINRPVIDIRRTSLHLIDQPVVGWPAIYARQSFGGYYAADIANDASFVAFTVDVRQHFAERQEGLD